ncbi:MAG: ABC transporter permease [Treponema sp.]|jgi:ribose/xylose/arabinose/galactoside ABC-type transport system permease subunit|nr:ABC transporter permease [Treponema sp.]
MQKEKTKGGSMPKIKAIFKNKTITLFFILVAMCILLGIANPKFFLYQNLMSLSRVVAYTSVIAIAELFVILIAGIDLSVGAVCGLGAVMSTMLFVKYQVPLVPSIAVALIAGGVVGACNGGMIIGLRLPPFIATMGSTQIIKSLALLLTNGKPIIGVSAAFLAIGQGTFLFIPIAVWILAVVAVIFSILLNKTVTGRRLYALGGGAEAAKFSGIKINKLTMFSYLVSGCMAALCGVILAARMGSAQGATGAGYEMDAIASVIIGGASFSGGEGKISGTIIGACIMSVIRNALVMLAVSTYLQSMIIGFIIVIAVAIDQFRKYSATKTEKRIIAATMAGK